MQHTNACNVLSGQIPTRRANLYSSNLFQLKKKNIAPSALWTMPVSMLAAHDWRYHGHGTPLRDAVNYRSVGGVTNNRIRHSSIYKRGNRDKSGRSLVHNIEERWANALSCDHHELGGLLVMHKIWKECTLVWLDIIRFIFLYINSFKIVCKVNQHSGRCHIMKWNSLQQRAV